MPLMNIVLPSPSLPPRLIVLMSAPRRCCISGSMLCSALLSKSEAVDSRRAVVCLSYSWLNLSDSMRAFTLSVSLPMDTCCGCRPSMVM